MSDSKTHKIRIDVDIPEARIMSRLRFSAVRTVRDSISDKLLRKTLPLASAICELHGIYAFIKISGFEDGKVKLGNRLEIGSRDIRKFLDGSSFILLMAVSSGKGIIASINEMIKDGKTGEAVILDAAASEITDAGMAHLHKFCSGLVLKEGLRVTRRRFSAGYGDFGLENQKLFFDFLDLEANLGLQLSESFQIIPEKSVTALAGVSPS